MRRTLNTLLIPFDTLNPLLTAFNSRAFVVINKAFFDHVLERSSGRAGMISMTQSIDRHRATETQRSGEGRADRGLLGCGSTARRCRESKHVRDIAGDLCGD